MKSNIPAYSSLAKSTFRFVASLRSAWAAIVAVLAILSLQSAASAAPTYTWTGGTNSNWDSTTTGNWNGGIPVNTATTAGNIYFAAPTSGNGTTTPLTLSLNYVPGSMNNFGFNGAAYTGSTGYTINAASTSSGDLAAYFYSIQSNMTGSGITETINAPLVAGLGGQGSGNIVLGNFTPQSAPTALYQATVGGYNNTLTIGGPITFTNASNNSSYTLNLDGAGNGNVTGDIVQNLDGGVVNIVMDSSATWTLSGNDSSLTGTTTLAGGGILSLDYSTDPADQKLASGILYFGSGGSLNYGAGGGELKLSGNTSGMTTGEVVSAIVIDPGASRIVISSTADSTELLDGSNWVPASDRFAGGTMDFTLTTTGAGVSSVVLPNAANTNGIFGGWATYGGGATWATIAGSGATAQVSGLAPAGFTSDTWAAGDNTDVVTDGNTIAAGATTNSLRFNSAAALNLTLGNGDILTSGGVLVTPSVGGNTVTISGGSLTPGSGNEIILNQYDTSANALLNVASPIKFGTTGGTNGTLTISGGGTVELSGLNFANTSTTLATDTIYINQGTLKLGNDGALGTEGTYVHNNVVLSAVGNLDLNGQSATLYNIHDDPRNYMNGTVSAQSGDADAITNSAAGTISTLTLTGGTFNVNYSFIDGGTTEASGAILSFTLSNGAGLFIGGADDYKETGTADNDALSGLGYNNNYDFFSGAVNILNGGIFVPSVANIDTYGVFYMQAGGANGSTYGNRSSGIGTTYLAGNGTISSATPTGPDQVLGVNLAGSGDVFSGSITGASGLQTYGIGTLTLTQAYSGTYDGTFYLTGTTTLITPGYVQSGPAKFLTSGNPTLELTGTSGTVLSGGFEFGGGTLWINPATVSSSTAVTVNGLVTSGAIGYFSENATIKLSADGNASVDFVLGNAADTSFIFNRTPNYVAQQGTLTIAPQEGLANLGNTDKLNFLGASTAALPTVTNGEVPTWIVGQDTDQNASAAFLTYVGTTGTAADAGFKMYTPSTTNFSSIAAATSGTGTATPDIQTAQTINYTTTTTQSIYSLEIDNNNATTDTGGTISGDDVTTTGALTFTSSAATAYNLNFAAGGALILNGGSISGNHLQINGSATLANALRIYASLAGGTITATAGYNISFTDVFGPGALTFGAGTTFNNNSSWYIQGGALDFSQLAANPTNQIFDLEGGVVELNGALGTFTPTLGTVQTAADTVNWGGVIGVGGGFAAHGTGGAGSGNLLVAVGGTGAITTPLVWGQGVVSSNFVSDGSDLMFGAPNANSIVNFENYINLGYANATIGGNTSLTSPYFRNVVVNAALADGVNYNPFAVSDPAVLSGAISSDAPFYGLALSGTGVLVLSNSGNTYTGATVIGGTASLLINNDTDLGTAPTAAYALNVDPTSGVAGGATTLGSVVIDGGATLGVYYAQGPTPGTYGTTTGTTTINPDRTILLASGTTGSTPSSIDVQTGTTAVFNGLIGDYIGEKGALNKNGLGTLNLGGANVYTAGTTVSAGRLNANATSGSSTGTGSVMVKSGATLGGTGIIQPGAATAGVSLASGAVLNPGSFSGSTVTGHLTLDNTTAASTILNAASGSTLVFSLGAGNNGYAFTPSVGSPFYGLVNTDSTFLSILGDTPAELTFAGVGVTITVNDLTGGTGLQFYNNQAYVLIDGTSNADFSGLITNTGMTGGVANNGFVTNLTLNGSATTDYNGLYLYLDNGDLLVVPEPGTWAMLAGGLAFLVFIRRFRRQPEWDEEKK